ncbi:MAG: phytoene/squalene synthase family protein, partial [Mesorhizobium sp.]
MDAVRASDHDRYLSALYAPADKRDALFSLYAFNAEIASVRDRIHEPLPGEVRLQWWRDVIAAENDAETGHPIADALRATISANRLPKTAFDNMLEARIFDLYDDPMPSRTDLEGYCGETAAALIQLAAMMLDPQEAPRFADLAGRAGCAQAITGLLLLLPLYRRRGQC